MRSLAEAEGVFRGSRADHHDGFIHFSTGEQVAETAARHFAGEEGLVLVAVDAEHLGPALRFEPSRVLTMRDSELALTILQAFRDAVLRLAY